MVTHALGRPLFAATVPSEIPRRSSEQRGFAIRVLSIRSVPDSKVARRATGVCSEPIVYGAAGVGADPGRRKRGPQAGFGRRYRSEPDQGHLTVQQSHPTRLYYAAVRIPDSELSQGNSRWAGPALGWFGIQLVLSLLACGHTLLSVLSIASCTATSCDYVAFSAAINTMYIGAAVLFVASAVAMFHLRARGRAMLWMPVVGSVMVILLLVGTYVAGRAALTLPLFGNRLSG